MLKSIYIGPASISNFQTESMIKILLPIPSIFNVNKFYYLVGHDFSIVVEVSHYWNQKVVFVMQRRIHMLVILCMAKAYISPFPTRISLYIHDYHYGNRLYLTDIMPSFREKKINLSEKFFECLNLQNILQICFQILKL